MKRRPRWVFILIVGPYFSKPRSFHLGFVLTMIQNGMYMMTRMIRIIAVVFIDLPPV